MSYFPMLLINYDELEEWRVHIEGKLPGGTLEKPKKGMVLAYKELYNVLNSPVVIFPDHSNASSSKEGLRIVICNPDLPHLNQKVRDLLDEWYVEYKTYD